MIVSSGVIAMLKISYAKIMKSYFHQFNCVIVSLYINYREINYFNVFRLPSLVNYVSLLCKRFVVLNAKKSIIYEILIKVLARNSD
jgi:hypothetical protein